ncbi:MAG: M23 family metallopeptidase [Deferribacteres bacterium]|nr:M23 family metallopeptidase [candidate division KSB1 bacterium]MCB9511552.1 M23 family metallopeptidase [Deferribacteres bacterium]
MRYNHIKIFIIVFVGLAVILGFSYFKSSEVKSGLNAPHPAIASAETITHPENAHENSLSEPEFEFESVRVRFGSTLAGVLDQSRASNSEANAIISAMRTVYNPRKIKAGDVIRIAKDEKARIAELHYKPATELTIIIKRDLNDQFIAVVDSLPVVTDTGYIFGSLETTVYDAVLEQGESPELIAAFTNVFQWDIDFFTEPRVGDQFAMIFEKQFVTDENTGRRSFLRYGKILAGAYLKQDSSYIAFNFPDEKGYSRFYDAQGNSFQKTFLKSPLNYSRIASYFSRGRMHPILKIVRPHTGVDYSAARGTPIVASADGRIIHIGWLGGYGKCIKISHKNGTFVTLYGHLSRFAAGLKVGSHIVQNQLIGYVGSTGLATGPHLHYTMYRNGKAIDPLKLRPSSGKQIEAEKMAAFSTRRDALLQQIGLLDHEDFSFSQQIAAIAR